MKKLLFLAAACLLATGAEAQRIEVVDTDGNGIPYASVLTAEADYLGITDLDGILADAKGAKAVTITHVAFKPKEVRLDGKDIRVTLEDADFCLAEITVQPKPYVYVQTYYRIFFFESKHGIVYYRTGLTDNAYDVKTRKLKANTSHFSTGFKGIITRMLNMLGSQFDKLSHLKVEKYEDRLKEEHKDIQLKITQTAPGHKSVSDFKGIVGSISDDMQTGLRHIAIDDRLVSRHKLEAKGKTKELAKIDEFEKKMENEQKSDFIIYNIDENGNYAPEDFLMAEFTDCFDIEYKGENIHVIFGLQVFSTDRAYVTKDELKQRQKDNQMKMTYQNILQFERQNNIPALAPVVSRAIGKLTGK